MLLLLLLILPQTAYKGTWSLYLFISHTVKARVLLALEARGAREKPVRSIRTRHSANLRSAFASKSVPHCTGSGVYSGRAY